MGEKLITFVIDGSPERNGAIPAQALLEKLRLFVAAMYGLERAFNGRDRNQIELEIVSLSRNSPASFGMRARAKEAGYDAMAATDWSFNQLVQLREGRPIDRRVSQKTLDNIVDLAKWRESKLPELGVVQIVHEATVLYVDESLAAQAMLARSKRREASVRPWKSGVSYGSLFGELRGVMDFDGERQFFIIPPSGPKKVQCTFPETLRDQMVEHLFRPVRVNGYLHYDGESPFPNRLEAEAIEGAPEPKHHFSSLRGMFKEAYAADAADLL